MSSPELFKIREKEVGEGRRKWGRKRLRFQLGDKKKKQSPNL